MTQYLLTDRDKYMLRRARDLVDEVERLRETLREIRLQTVGSPNMDGMPKGGGDGDAMARRIIRKDKIESKLKAAERALNRARTVGGKALRDCRAPVRLFCEAYYLEAGTLEESCKYARIDRRTAERYCAMIGEGRAVDEEE